ncbi:hypothetical protein QYE76_061945 [Lolium multiflorum]|uniref:Uncharacterized protein n=1 Tax=Lolium multiflorum TaxID=4521 RepID=A0AAD8S2T1_LOLMU|nr:hypothetical protein QYE76_061945 [Lolium multiflorum]
MGGCYSAYASSRKLHGRLGNLSFVLPVEQDAANNPADTDNSCKTGSNNPDAGGTEEEELVTKTTAAEFARRYVLGKELGRGEFGVTRRCRDAATGESLACKTGDSGENGGVAEEEREGDAGGARDACGGAGPRSTSRRTPCGAAVGRERRRRAPRRGRRRGCGVAAAARRLRLRGRWVRRRRGCVGGRLASFGSARRGIWGFFGRG